jgi:hypothetical protein
MELTKHIVAEMDESMVQRCIIFGEVISDYRNCSYLLDQGPPKGYSAGAVYVSNTKNPQIFLTEAAMSEKDFEMVKNCR